MAEKSYATEVYKKMEQELDQFIAELKIMSPEEVISCSYEKVMKEDFLLLFGESVELSEEEAVKLLQMEKPLDFVYQKWLGSDSGHMDVLLDFVNGELSRELKRW